MEKTQTLRELVELFGANGFVIIDDGNGSAGPAWVSWDDDIDAAYGNTRMSQVDSTAYAYEYADTDEYQSKDSIAKVVDYVVKYYSCDDGAMSPATRYASDWIACNRNGYKYRIIF